MRIADGGRFEALWRMNTSRPAWIEEVESWRGAVLCVMLGCERVIRHATCLYITRLGHIYVHSIAGSKISCQRPLVCLTFLAMQSLDADLTYAMHCTGS